MKVHPALTEEHEAFRETLRRFVAKELSPHAAAWDEAGEFPTLTTIGGGPEEIMTDLAARQPGWQ